MITGKDHPYTGVIKFFDHNRSFGFIAIDRIEDIEVFVGGRGLDDSYFAPEKGDRVEFFLQDHSRGPRAINVKKLED